jgi:hypothetical protein
MLQSPAHVVLYICNVTPVFSITSAKTSCGLQGFSHIKVAFLGSKHLSFPTSIMYDFKPDKALLNPKFEGYKLDPVEQDELVSRFPLLYQPSQSIVSATKAPLSFPEVQSRITHNHLIVSPDGSRAVYVDSEYRIISIDFTTVSPTPFVSESCI